MPLSFRSGLIVAPATVGPPVLTFVGTFGLSASGSTRTSSAVNIGNPSYITTRRVILIGAANSNANGPLVSATINGVTATIHLDYEPSGNNWIQVISAVVSSGTTNVTVTLTYSGAQFAGWNGAVYIVDDTQLASSTPTTGTNVSTVGVTSLATSALSTQAGGFIIACVSLDANGTGVAITGLTTDGFGGTSILCISSLGSLAGGSMSPTATWTGAQPAAIAAAAWR